jgi:hypothetical protein
MKQIKRDQYSKDRKGNVMNLENLYVIRGKDDLTDSQPLFWNNEDGYCDLSQAAVYLETEVKAGKYNLPIEGEWQNLKSAMSELIEWTEGQE